MNANETRVEFTDGDLLCCPFCGGRGVIVFSMCSDRMFVVIGCGTKDCREHAQSQVQGFPVGDIAVHVNLWNKRPWNKSPVFVKKSQLDPHAD